jgi:hypothetical protein
MDDGGGRGMGDEKSLQYRKSVDMRTILKWALNMYGLRVWSGFKWLRKGPNCGLQ